MTKLRIAAIGAGSMPRSRSRAYFGVITKLTDMYELCAVCDHDAARAKAAAQAYGVAATYTDVEEMLRGEQPDVALRLTPTDSCVCMCTKAAEHGCHVLTEIPIAPTLPMADAIIDACERNGVKLEVAENVWLWPQERLKRQIVEAGLLGTLTHARLVYPCGSYHGFNGIRMIIGAEPERVLGYAGEAALLPTTSYGGEPMTEAFWETGVVEFPDGVACLYEMPPKGREPRRLWEIEGTHGYLAGDELVLYEEGREVRYPIEWVEREQDGEPLLECVRINTDPPVAWHNPYARYGISAMDDVAKAAILESMYRAVIDDAEPAYGARNARRDQELCIAVRESARQGSVWMTLPIESPTALEQRLHDEFQRRYGCHPVNDIDAQMAVAFDRISVMWTVAGWL